MNICEMNNIICETEMYDAWVAAGVFETDEIEEFMEQLQKNISQFCNEYKEKMKNVQNY